MAKRNGLGMYLLAGGYDLSGDVGQIDALETGRVIQDVTTITKGGHERMHLRKGGRVAFTGFFDDAALAEHVALKAVPTTDVATIVLFSATLGDVAAGITGKRTGYPLTRNADGSLGWSNEILSNDDDLQYGKSLTAGPRTDTSATNGTGVDFGVGSTTFGLVAYAIVTSVTGTSITLTIQESSDNGAGDAFAAVTGGAFTVVAAGAVGHQRIETSVTQTVERYLRVVSTGTFNPATFAVMAKRYASASREL